MDNETGYLIFEPDHKRISKLQIQRWIILMVGLGVLYSVVFYLQPLARITILISIDGFRFDYIHKRVSPTLIKLAGKGVMASLQPQFPSYTFPNHYTLVTGLFPASHGIISNRFYDPLLNCSFFHHNESIISNPKWWNGQPIWNSLEEMGRKTAVLHWPGSAVLINGHQPSYWEHYNGSMSDQEKFNKLLKWIKDDPEIEFVALYASAVDNAAHKYGPDSDQVLQAVKSTDAAIKDLLVNVGKMGYEVDIVIVSDHGMAGHSKENVIYVEDLAKEEMNSISWIETGPVTSIWTELATTSNVYDAIKKSIKNMQIPLQVYLRDEMPARYNFNNNSRIAPIYIVAEIGWSVYTKDSGWIPGMHGYDPKNEEMTAIFIADGPSFEKGLTLSKYQNVDVYPVLAKILNADPFNHNGTDSLLKRVIV